MKTIILLVVSFISFFARFVIFVLSLFNKNYTFLYSIQIFPYLELFLFILCIDISSHMNFTYNQLNHHTHFVENFTLEMAENKKQMKKMEKELKELKEQLKN